MIEVVGLALVLLHAPDGRGVLINPTAVVSMHAGTEGKTNALIIDTARCLINMSDGKFVSVMETCDKVRELLFAPKGDKL